MVAIEEFCRKVDKFDPSRGEFNSFFDATIGNSIKDQIRKALGDRSYGLNNPDRDSFEDCGESVTNEDEELILKREKFADEMVDELMKFIDTLPDDMRLILYRSEFGRMLNSVLGEVTSKRGYADLIAARNERSAAAVRKVAERMKAKAIDYVKSKGYDRDAYFSIGFLTSKPTENTVDYSTFDWTAFSGVQRLRLRMYLYDKAIADGVISAE